MRKLFTLFLTLWALALGADSRAQPILSMPSSGPTYLAFYGAGNRLTISINTSTGEVIFGEGVTPSAASLEFWAEVQRTFVGRCEIK